jgi:hypothetical protein
MAHLFDFRNSPAGGLVVTLEIPFHKDDIAAAPSEKSVVRPLASIQISKLFARDS